MSFDRYPPAERAPALDRDGRAAYRVETTDRSPSVAVVEAVSAVSGTDPLADGPVLYDAVNPDALDRLFAECGDDAARPVGRVTFELRGCLVEVRSDGGVVVYEPVEGDDGVGSSAVGSA